MTRQSCSADGKIRVVTGCVYSGKTEELIRRVKQAELAHLSIQTFRIDPTLHKPLPEIVSHSGLSLPASVVTGIAEVENLFRPDTHLLAIDEAQFLELQAVESCIRLADRGVRVLLAGLDMDFRGKPFGPMGAFLAVAERIKKRRAICVICGRPATRSQRLIENQPALCDTPIIMRGRPAVYEPRCRICHQVFVE